MQQASIQALRVRRSAGPKVEQNNIGCLRPIPTRPHDRTPVAGQARDIYAIECVCGPQVVDRSESDLRLRCVDNSRMLSSIQECKMNAILAWLQ